MDSSTSAADITGYNATPIVGRLKKINVRNLSQSFIDQHYTPSNKRVTINKKRNRNETLGKIPEKSNKVQSKQATKKRKSSKDEVSEAKRSRGPGTSSNEKPKKRISRGKPTPCKNMELVSPINPRSKPRKPRTIRKKIKSSNVSIAQRGVFIDANPWDVGGHRKKSDLNEFDLFLEVIEQVYCELKDSGAMNKHHKVVREAMSNYCQMIMKQFSKQILAVQEVKTLNKELLKEKSEIRSIDVELREARQAIIRKNFNISKMKKQLAALKPEEDTIQEFLQELTNA